MSFKSVLAIFAHPDDETLFAGGLLAKSAAEGANVQLVTVTSGGAGQTFGLCSQRELAAVRELELEQAAKILGIASVYLLRYGDGTLANINSAAPVHKLMEIIRAVAPDLIVTHGPDGTNNHSDHIAVSAYVTAAIAELRQSDGCSPVLYYPCLDIEVLRLIGVPENGYSSDSVVEVDTTAVAEMKAVAAAAHRTQNLAKYSDINLECWQHFLEREKYYVAG